MNKYSQFIWRYRSLNSVAETASLNNLRINEPNNSVIFVGHSIVIVHLRCKLKFTYRIWGSHSGGYEEFCFLGYNAILIHHWPTPWLLLLFSFIILYTVSRTPWARDQLVARPLPTHRITQTQNKCTQTSMPRVGFEPTTPTFERATVYALDSADNRLVAPYWN
jgi:hypothetical protein